MIRFAFLASVVLALEACPPAPAPPDSGPPSLDASKPATDASTAAGAACANMAALGCIEGTAGDCGVTLDHVAATRLTPINIGCITAATSKVDVRRCGSIGCP